MTTEATESAGVTFVHVEPYDYSVEGKLCSMPSCGHKAAAVWQWAPGHLDGYRCNCCMRAVWEETLEDVQKSLAELPEDCD